MKLLAACVVLAMHIVPAPAAIAAEREGTHSAFSLIAQSAQGWEIRYVPRPRRMTTVEIDGRTYLRFVDPGTMHEQDDATGKPSLPADALTLGIPFGAHLTAELVDVEFSDAESIHLAPHPAYEFTQDNDAIEVFRKDPRAYALDAYFPASLLEVEKPFTLREQHLAVVRIHPYQYNPAAATLKVYALDRANNGRLIAETVLDSIPVEGSRTTTVPISTVGFGYRTLLQVVVRSLRGRMDLVPENNVAYYTLYKSGIGPPKFLVYNDGKLLMDGDYVRPNPTIVVKVPAGESTPAAVRMDLFVNDAPVEHATALLSKSVGGKSSTLEETFMPSLSKGTHALKFRLTVLSERGIVDTLEHTLNVQVSEETKIVETYTYPNPFPRDTYFTFVLAGAAVPEEMRIRIYTVAGRKIRDIELPGSSLHIGFNQVHWDGRDDDGDEIANGYYFYEVMVKQGGKTHAAVQKLVKLR